MGYYTDYKITIINKYKTRKYLNKLLYVVNQITNYNFQIENFAIINNCKWYEHNKDMRTISSILPKLKIKIEGKGEEEGDEWIKIFQNGLELDPNHLDFFSDLDDEYKPRNEYNGYNQNYRTYKFWNKNYNNNRYNRYNRYKRYNRYNRYNRHNRYKNNRYDEYYINYDYNYGYNRYNNRYYRSNYYGY